MTSGDPVPSPLDHPTRVAPRSPDAGDSGPDGLPERCNDERPRGRFSVYLGPSQTSRRSPDSDLSCPGRPYVRNP